MLAVQGFRSLPSRAGLFSGAACSARPHVHHHIHAASCWLYCVRMDKSVGHAMPAGKYAMSALSAFGFGCVKCSLLASFAGLWMGIEVHLMHAVTGLRIVNIGQLCLTVPPPPFRHNFLGSGGPILDPPSGIPCAHILADAKVLWRAADDVSLQTISPVNNA